MKNAGRTVIINIESENNVFIFSSRIGRYVVRTRIGTYEYVGRSSGSLARATPAPAPAPAPAPTPTPLRLLLHLRKDVTRKNPFLIFR